MKNQETNYRSAAGWRVALWPAHQTASAIMSICMGFAGYLATGYYGILVAVAGYIATGTRLLDAWIDPFLAMITDRVETKFGRVRILMLVGRAIQYLCLFGLFFWGIGSGPVVYTAIYCVYVIGASIAAIATHTGNALLTNDPKQRPKIFRWMMIYSTIISTFASAYMSGYLFRKHRGLNIGAFQELSLTVMVIGVILEILAFIAITASDRPELLPRKKDGSKVSFKDGFKFLVGNRPMQMYLIAGVSDKLAQNANSSAVVMLLYGVVMGNYAFNGTFRLIALPFTLAMLFVVSYLSGKKGSRKSVVLYSLICIALACIMVAFMALTDPAQITVNALTKFLFIALSIGISCCSMSLTSASQSLLPDIIDYEYYRSGAFMPGVAGVVYSFIDEFVSSLGQTISAVCISAVGYVAVQPQEGDPCTPAIFWITMFLSYGMPILGWCLNLIAMKFYELTPERMEEIQKTIAARQTEPAK